jgi:tetratricopeptide (TPR) repeat protein
MRTRTAVKRATRTRLFATVFLFLWSTGVAYAGGNQEQAPENAQGIDYLGIAAVMIRDGNFERAKNALNQVDTSDEDLDLARYFTLRGLLNLRQQNYEDAVADFERAMDEGQEDQTLNIYLAQALYHEGQYERALALINSITGINRYPDLISLRAEALWKLDRVGDAYEEVSRLIDLFPSRNQYLRQRITYLIELGLTQEAAEQSRRFVENAGGEPDAYVTVGEALRRGGQVDSAIQVLEMGVLEFPANGRIKLALAQAYLDKERPRSAGHLVEQAAATNFQLYHEAAEIYRRAGSLERALYLNSQVPDEERKTRQRLNLLLALERYEQAVALEPRLERIGALEEDSVRYAVAYAHFQIGRYEQAASHINRISSSEYFGRATQLRQAIETVRNERVRYF